MNKNKAVSIVDVARLAGLSQATVSRVLNKSGYFSHDTLEKVEQAVKTLGYEPNWMARGLKGKPSKLVGLIIPDISNVFYTAVAKSMLDALENAGYEMVLCVNDEDPQKDLAYLRVLEQKRVDGILYAHPSGGSNAIYLRELLHAGIPIVEVNRQREVNLLDAVLPDNTRGVQQMMKYLLSLGHRRIALINGSDKTTTGSERLAGYHTALAEAGIKPDPNLLKIGSFNREFGEQAMSELLDLPFDERPTAVFAGSNRIALGVLFVLGQREIHIPAEISVAAFDDTEWLAAWNPPVTAVDIAVHEMSQLAVDLLIRRMNETEMVSKPVTYHLGTSLIIRQSCTAI